MIRMGLPVQPKNLLDNSYWEKPKEIVNQRNAGGTYAEWGGYTIDRWVVGGEPTTISLGTGGLNLKGYLYQVIPNPERLVGKAVTLAMKVNGNIYCKSGVVQLPSTWSRIIRETFDWGSYELCTQDDNALWACVDGNDTISVEWIALYEGAYTLETLPPYRQKGYAAELAECQRYALVVPYNDTLFYGNSGNASGGGGRLYLPIPCEMRIASPSVPAFVVNVSTHEGFVKQTTFTPTAIAAKGTLLSLYGNYSDVITTVEYTILQAQLRNANLVISADV